jgi:hypothetical protein
MKAAAFVLSAFTSFPPGPGAASIGSPTTVGWPDTWLLRDPLGAQVAPEAAEDPLGAEPLTLEDVSAEEQTELDPQPRYVFVGCELALGGNLAPDAWARDLWLGLPPPHLVENGHFEKDGHWLDYDQIPRRPGRPEQYALYRYPVADAQVVSGYDLDKPDAEQRRGRMNAVGHGGVDLVAEMGTPIKMVRLEHQLRDAEVVFVGTLYGETVVTRHVVREGGVAREYILIFGHLDRAADDVRRGRRLREGDLVGYVGNSDSPQLVHLHLEARRMRDGIDAWRVPGAMLKAAETSVVTDPRNVLPLKVMRLPSPRCSPRLTSEPRRYWLGSTWTLSLGDEATTE